jgi:hypothetical protein
MSGFINGKNGITLNEYEKDLFFIFFGCDGGMFIVAVGT